jgi:hypothetical protein
LDSFSGSLLQTKGCPQATRKSKSSMLIAFVRVF